MKIPWTELEFAFEHVASDTPGMCSAFVNRATGEVFLHSELDDFREWPQDIDDETRWATVPHRSMLDLGEKLVFEFVEERLPAESGHVVDLFRRRGAYRRFRDLLDRHDLLEDWREYEADARRQALLDWCAEEEIAVEGLPEPRLTVLRGGEPAADPAPAARDDALVVFETGSFVVSQAGGTRLPGYLIVEDRRGRTRLSDLAADERAELFDLLAMSELVVREAVRPERVYVLRFGDEVERIHFHVVPRTKELAAVYAADVGDEPPWRGARLMDWLWRHHERLGHTDDEIRDFVTRARAAWRD